MAEHNAAVKAKSTNLKKYYRDSVGELKKVVWPNRQQVTSSTVAVIGSVVVVGVFIWIFDVLLQLLRMKVLGF